MTKVKQAITVGFLTVLFVFCSNAEEIKNGELKKTASEKLTYNIPRVDEVPVIDAVIGLDEWKNATQIELAYEINPGDNLPARVKTTAYMMEDGEQIYFAFKAQDPNPEKILAYFRDRDGIFQDDFLGVIIDTFNDERRGFEFFVNPLGAQADLTRDDSRNNEDSSWDATWDSLGKVTDDGYVVEMAIPYRAIRFPAGKMQQKWGIQFLRIYPRSSRFLFSNGLNDRDADCSVCQYNKVEGMPNIKTGRNIDVTPTLTYINAEKRDPEAGTDWQETASEFDAGLNVRWAMTENWILNGTFNPDFSQVSADAGQLDINTTFSLFFPESRPFFLDGADYFTSSNQLVHTRNIADPDFGIKVTGKQDGQSAGVIIAQDTSTSFLIPGNQGSDIAILGEGDTDVFVARYQKDIGDKNNFGVLATHRSSGDYSNDVLAFDGKYYFSKNDSIDIQYMRSDSDNPFDVQTDFKLAPNQQDRAYTLRYRHNEEDYYLYASHSDFGKDFRADMGFISQVDYTKSVVGGGYTWFGEKDSKWTRWGLGGDWDITKDQSGKQLEKEIEMQARISGPKQSHLKVGITSRDKLYESADVNHVFDEKNIWTWFQFNPWSSLRVGSFMLIGDSIDYANVALGKMTILEPFTNWQLGKHFNVRLSTVFKKMDVEGGELFDAQLIDLRMVYQFNIRSKLALTLQGSDITRNLDLYTDSDDLDRQTKSFGTQLIYSYKINPLSLMYLGYSDSGFQNDNLSKIHKTDRTVFAKFSYMWQI